MNRYRNVSWHVLNKSLVYVVTLLSETELTFNVMLIRLANVVIGYNVDI